MAVQEKTHGSYRYRPPEQGGRLKLPAVRALLYEHAKLSQQGELSLEAVEELARRYAVDQGTLLRVLEYNRLPRLNTDQSS